MADDVIYYPNEGLEHLYGFGLGKWAGPPSWQDDWRVVLLKADFTISTALTWADVSGDIADFDGYADAAPGDNSGYVNGSDEAQVDFTNIQFTCTGNVTPNTIYGWALKGLDEGGNPKLLACLHYSTTRPMTDITDDPIDVVVNLRLKRVAATTVYFPNEGLLTLFDFGLGQWSGEPITGNWRFELLKADFADDDPDLTWADVSADVADFDGYAAQTPAVGAGSIDGSDRLRVDLSPVTFLSTGDSTPNTIYGWALRGANAALTPKLLCVRKYDTPVVVSVAGQTIPITFNLRIRRPA